MGAIVDLIFPRTCVGCGTSGKYLCETCKKNIEIIGADFKNKKIEGRVGLFKYHGVIKDLIALLKFEFVSDVKIEIGEMICNQLRENYPNILEYWQKENFVITPVPLHWRRENWRGFNQAEIIANEVGKILNLKIDNNKIRRIVNTKKQAISNKVERQGNMKGAFGVFGKLAANIIIFDDVWTTGNTIKNIIKIIPKNRKIWVLSLATGN